MKHRKGSTPISKGCGQSLKGVDLSIKHRRGSTPSYKECGESSKGVDPSMDHRRGPFIRATVIH